MSDSELKSLKKIKGYKIFFPIVIGLSVIIYFLTREIQLDKIQADLLNYTSQPGWVTTEHNQTNDTILLLINDSTIFSLDTLRIEIKYFVKNKKEIIEVIDTVNYFSNDTISIKNAGHQLKTLRLERDKLKFIFTTSLRTAFGKVKINAMAVFWFIVAMMMMMIRDVGYMWRLRILSDKELSWRKSFIIIILWEFTSAVTPSGIGGTAFAVIFLIKENISVGKSTAIILLTTLLDQLFFVTMIPLLFILTGKALFLVNHTPGANVSVANEFFYFALFGYTLISIFTIAVIYGIFINPKGLKTILINLFRLPFLSKWKHKAEQAGDDLITSSKEFKNKPVIYWIKAFASTFVSWTGRYWIVNFLILSLVSALNIDHIQLDHLVIFARQLVMWIMQHVSPTPGASGFMEYVFSRYLGEFIPVGFIFVLAFIWRLLSYYPYLVAGALVFPRWLKAKFGIKKISKNT